jgi:predicted outer membrane repeat protein
MKKILLQPQGCRPSGLSPLRAVALILAIACCSAASATIYVKADATGNNDGTTWANAYTAIGTAISAATADNDEIWIAGGTYNIATSILLNNHGNGFKIYGGFEGTEAAVSARPKVVDGEAWEFQYPTVLKLTVSDVHMLYKNKSGASLLIDGLTFDGDNRTQSQGIAIRNGSTTIQNCIIKNFDNSAGMNNVDSWDSANARGAGVTVGAPTTITNCLITNNKTKNSNGGGGVSIYYNTTLIISNSILSNNTATGTGGALRVDAGTVTVTNSTFSNNTATDRGGGIYANAGTVDIADSNITGNTSDDCGGGIYVNSDAIVTVNNSVIKSNTSANEGGAISVRSAGNLTLKNCVVAANSATSSSYGYGGIYADYSTFTLNIHNCVITDNKGSKCSGIYHSSSGKSNLANNIFYNNQNGDFTSNSTCNVFANNIITALPALATLNLPFSVADKATLQGNNIVGTVDATAIFTDAANGDYTLKSGSPAAGRGTGSTDIGITGDAASPLEIGYYYVYFSQRRHNDAGTSSDNDGSTDMANYVLTDKGTGNNLLTQSWTTPDADTQTWNFVYANGSFKMISKGGAYIDYNNVTDRFITSATDAGSTVSFAPNTVNSVANQWNINISGAGNMNVTSTGICRWGANPTDQTTDAGNAVMLLPAPPDLTGATWYRIQFKRQQSNNKSLQGADDGQRITQATSANTAAQYWRFTGVESALQIVNYNGLFIKDNTNPVLNAAGNNFELQFSFPDSYYLKDLTKILYLNDESGNYACYYSLDGGCNVIFTPVPTVPVTVSVGSNINNVAVATPADASVGTVEVPLNAYITITYEVEADYAPVVMVNGQSVGVGDFLNGTYTLTVPNITATTAIAITAELAQHEVTVNATNGITVTSPTLDGSNKFTSSSTAVVLFALADGYENPTYTVGGGVPQTPTLVSGSNYSITLSGISAATTVSISAAPVNYTYTVTATNATVTSSYNATYTVEDAAPEITFTVDNDCHTPYVSVNGVYVQVTKQSNSYSLNAPVTANTSVVIYAYPQNIVPVNADTYVRTYNSTGGTNYSNYTELWTRGQNGGPIAMQFNIPAETKAVMYNKAELKLRCSRVDAGTGAQSFKLSEIPSSIATAINDMTGNNSKSALDALPGELFSDTQTPVADALFSFDVTAAAVQADIVRLAYAASNTSKNNQIWFHSLENGNAEYVPVLVFSQPAFVVGATETKSWNTYTAAISGGINDGDHYGDIVIESTDASTGQLTGITSNATVNGVVKYRCKFSAKKWYAVGFPFDIASVSTPGVDYNLETYDENGDNTHDNLYGDYWARTYDGTNNVFNDYTAGSETLSAGGYVIQVPDAFDGEELTFTSAPSITLNADNAAFDFTPGGYKMTANPSLENKMLTPGTTASGDSDDYYCLGAWGTGYEQNFGLIAASAPAETPIGVSVPNSYTLKPFESVVVARAITQALGNSTGNTLRSFMSTENVDAPTGMSGSSFDGEPVSVRCYNLQGIEIAQPAKGQAYIVREVYKSGAVKAWKAVK